MKSIIQKLHMFQYLLGYKFGKSKLHGMPLFLWIEPTNNCNLKCSICSREFGSREAGFMDLELYRNIIDQIKKINPVVLTLHLAGEPLLHPKIHEMIQIASENRIHTTFSTNGMLLSEEIVEKLIKSGLISLRIDFTPDREKFESSRNGASWDRVYSNIRNLLKTKKERNLSFPLVTIQAVQLDNHHDMKKEIEGLHKLFEDAPPNEFTTFRTHTWAGSFASSIREKSSYNITVQKNRFSPCLHLWSSFVICWNGDVVPCCRDLNAEMIINNVKNIPIREIWNSEKYIELRKKHIEKNVSDILLCSTCSKPYERISFIEQMCKYVYRRFDSLLKSRRKSEHR